jgi:hypothetical protein
MKKKSVGLLELETAVLECFWEKTPLNPLGVKNPKEYVKLQLELSSQPLYTSDIFYLQYNSKILYQPNRSNLHNEPKCSIQETALFINQHRNANNAPNASTYTLN